MVGFQNELSEKILEFCHANEHMAAKWTSKKYPSAEINTATLNTKSIQTNAFTTLDMTGYHMKGLSAHQSLMAKMFAASFVEPQYDGSVFDAEMAAVQNELGNIMNSPFYDMDTEINKTLFAGTPLQFGEKEKIANVQRLRDAGLDGMEELLTWRENSYCPSLCSLFICGDFRNETLQLLLEKFGSISRAKKLPSITGSSPHGLRGLPRLHKTYNKRPEKMQRLCVFFPISCTKFDFEDRVIIECIVSILTGSGLGARLYAELRTKRKLVYAVSSSPMLFVCKRLQSFFCIETNFRVDDGQDIDLVRGNIIEGIKTVVDKLMDEKPTHDEMKQWRNFNRLASIFAKGDKDNISNPSSFYSYVDYVRPLLCYRGVDITHKVKTYIGCTVLTKVVDKTQYLQMMNKVTTDMCLKKSREIFGSPHIIFTSDNPS